VTDISGNAGGATDIEEGELSDARVELEEEGQRLADSTAGTEDGNLGKLYSKSNVSGRASDVFNGRCGWGSSPLTLLAEAEKARRWTAPTTDWET